MRQGKHFLKTQSLAPDAIICGLDEVGRGCWAGPLFACALVLKKDLRHPLLRDSKELTSMQRELMYNFIVARAFIGLGMADASEIDQWGLVKATNIAFERALEQLMNDHPEIKPDYLLIDGRDKLRFSFPFQTIIKGDQKVKEISAASIIAKVTRDRFMVEVSRKFPNYGFEKHKGYGTLRHQKALNDYGLTNIHRKIFKPIQTLMEKQISILESLDFS